MNERNKLLDEAIAALETRYKIMTHSGSSNTYRRHLVGYIKELERLKDGPPIAAPASQPDVKAWLVDGRVEQGLFFDKASAEVMAEANCGTVRPLVLGGECSRSYSREEMDAAAIRNKALNECAQICDEMEQHYSDYKDTALLNGDVALSNAASGEPRACRFIAERIRALATQSNEPAQQEPIGFLRKTEHVLVFMPLTSKPLEDGMKFYAAPTAQQAGQPAPALPEGREFADRHRMAVTGDWLAGFAACRAMINAAPQEGKQK